MRARRLLGLLVLPLLLASACTKPQVDADIAAVVTAYANGLPSVLAGQSLDSIRPYATPDQIDRMRLYVILVTEERREMIRARLVNQRVVTTEVAGERATATASEEWSLVYTDRDTGEELRREDHAEDVQYRLVRVKGQWYVDEVITE